MAIHGHLAIWVPKIHQKLNPEPKSLQHASSEQQQLNMPTPPQQGHQFQYPPQGGQPYQDNMGAWNNPSSGWNKLVAAQRRKPTIPTGESLCHQTQLLWNPLHKRSKNPEGKAQLSAVKKLLPGYQRFKIERPPRKQRQNRATPYRRPNSIP